MEDTVVPCSTVVPCAATPLLSEGVMAPLVLLMRARKYLTGQRQVRDKKRDEGHEGVAKVTMDRAQYSPHPTSWLYDDTVAHRPTTVQPPPNHHPTTAQPHLA